MAAYHTIVVGTDGSESSFRAVDRAAKVAADTGARLVLLCAYHPMPEREVQRAQDQLRDEAFLVVGSTPAESALSIARDRAVAAGATDVETRAVEGEAVEALIEATRKYEADLLVVGNRGLNTLVGRILGSVPSEVTRKAPCDVLVVHTTRGGRR